MTNKAIEAFFSLNAMQVELLVYMVNIKGNMVKF